MGAGPRIDRIDRNLLINGNFDYWQRGTSIAAASVYGADRWKGNSAQASQVRRDRTYSSGLPAGSRYGNHVTSAVGGNELFQRIEASKLTGLVGKYLTFSFKAGLVSGTTLLSMNVRKPTATDNYASSSIVASSSNFAAPAAHTGTYTTYKWTFLVDQDMADKGFAVSIQGDATVWQIIFAQMMLMVTESNVDFIPSSYVYHERDVLSELLACQRYYEVFSGPGGFGFDNSGSASAGQAYWGFKVTKRANPILGIGSTLVANSRCYIPGGLRGINSVVGNSSSTSGGAYTVTMASPGTQYQGGIFAIVAAGVDDILTADAEL